MITGNKKTCKQIKNKNAAIKIVKVGLDPEAQSPGRKKWNNCINYILKPKLKRVQSCG